MFSKKEVFENYLGKLGLNKTAFEAVKDINGVLFEGLDDLLGDLENEVNQEDGDEEIVPVPEFTTPPEKKNEYDSIELEGKYKIPFGEAINLAMLWAKKQPRFSQFWDNDGGFKSPSYMLKSESGETEFYSKDRVPYVVHTERDESVPKAEYETATNYVKMSSEVYDRVMKYFNEQGYDDLTEVPFDDIKHLVLGNAIHQTGTEAPNIGIECTVEIDPSVTLLTTQVENRDPKNGLLVIIPGEQQKLSEETGLPVDGLYTAVLREWTDYSDQYYWDSQTGFIYDVTKKSDAHQMTREGTLTPSKIKKEHSLALGRKVIDWARTQDMFKLLLKPRGADTLIYTSSIHKVPNDGNIEGVGNAPYVYMDDENYESFVNSTNFDTERAKHFDANALNQIVSKEYKDRSLTNTVGSNDYGYDDNGWVTSIECVLDEKSGVYTLAQGVAGQIIKAYGRKVEGYNNYIAGKNSITVGEHSFHPLVLLSTSRGGLYPRLVAFFDETCCKPGESIEQIVGAKGMRGGVPTIQGFATIMGGCKLASAGDVEINQCTLRNVDISGSTGRVRIGSRPSKNGASLLETRVEDTVIAVGNNGADQVLPNNRIYAEMNGGIRGVSIVKSFIVDAHISNGYAQIEDCNIQHLNMSNDGPKHLDGWNTEDASNVVFKGDNLITITGNANYLTGYSKSTIPGGRAVKDWKKGEVTTELTGEVTLDSTAGTVVCRGSKLHNVVANGPCGISSCTLKGATIGVNALGGNGNFEKTEMNCVNTTPAVDGAWGIQIEHGTDGNATVFGVGTDKTPGMIELSGRVYIEGGAKIMHSLVASTEDGQTVYVRSNMTLNGCSPYTLNKKDSGILSKYLRSDTNLRGDCTDITKIANNLDVEFNAFGGENSLALYADFKAGKQDESMKKNLTLFDADTLIDDFLVDTSSILMDSSVLMGMDGDGNIIPNESLKRTIWDPIGGFFVGPVNEKIDDRGRKVKNYGSMILLKCPNVVLDHDAIVRKKDAFVQNMDFDMYAAGKITLREYVDFLDKNGFSDCYHYANNGFGKEFVQLCQISKTDMRTPRNLSMAAMKTLIENSKRIIDQFIHEHTTNNTTIRNADNYSRITSAYTNKDGAMTVEAGHGQATYQYSIPRVDDEKHTIVCSCTKKVQSGEGPAQIETYKVDCSRDAIYKAGYQYMCDNNFTSNADGLAVIRKAVFGDVKGLGKQNYVASALNAMKGTEMKSNELDPESSDKLNKILSKLNLEKNEKVYRLDETTSEGEHIWFLVKAKPIYLSKLDREKYRLRGITPLNVCHILKYLPEKDTFACASKYVPKNVKMKDNLQASSIYTSDYVLARPVALQDFYKMGVPEETV